jgi:hypothetical protein
MFSKQGKSTGRLPGHEDGLEEPTNILPFLDILKSKC